MTAIDFIQNVENKREKETVIGALTSVCLRRAKLLSPDVCNTGQKQLSDI